MSAATHRAQFDAIAAHPQKAVHEVVREAARASIDRLGGDRGLVLAISGGCDSMVLLDAVDAAIAARDDAEAVRARVIVATFDHATGPSATAAADLVEAEATRRRFAVARGRAAVGADTEAEWRSARWKFLLGIRPPNASVATAHTRDDHLETVVMRCLRDAGARGLAGLEAGRRHVIRPFLGLPRDAVRAYAQAHRVAFIDDPSNDSRRHLRNRVRLDLLPAIRRVRPTFGEEMLWVAKRAAEWRGDVDRLASRYVSESPDERAIRVARHELASYDSTALCVLWPAIAARAGITLDRRGTRRLAQFTTEGASGARIQLSGGIEIVRERDVFVVRPLGIVRPEARELPLVGVVELDGWRFTPETTTEHPSYAASVSDPVKVGSAATPADMWTCDLPADCRLSVRVWRPADRMRSNVTGAARRVKRFFADAQVSGPSRIGWPVVLADDEIVWIPGIRRSVAAPERSGRPVVRYTCERFERGSRQRS